MEENKRGRGRPRLDTRHTEAHAPSRRQAVNSMYMFGAIKLVLEADTEIPDSELLWCSDDITKKATSKNVILEQIGRMLLQDKYDLSDCVYITNLSIAAVKKRMHLQRDRKSNSKYTVIIKRCSLQTRKHISPKCCRTSHYCFMSDGWKLLKSFMVAATENITNQKERDEI